MPAVVNALVIGVTTPAAFTPASVMINARVPCGVNYCASVAATFGPDTVLDIGSRPKVLTAGSITFLPLFVLNLYFFLNYRVRSAKFRHDQQPANALRLVRRQV